MQLAGIHDMSGLPIRKSGQSGPWKHHVIVNGTSACMRYPVIEASVKPAIEVFEWNRCRILACARRWPNPDPQSQS